MENPTLTRNQPQRSLIGPGGELPLDRRTVEALAEFFVGMLDLVEPEPDAEPDFSEDDAVLPPWWGEQRGDGAGCPIADPDYGGEEAGEPEQGCAAPHTGIDQSRSINADNPAVL
jgi:hypothetical protein